jgi:hypothetical protein
MTRARRIHKATNKTKNITRLQTSNLSLEERLKVIGNLIVDRIIEDQRNGNLRFKIQNNM